MPLYDEKGDTLRQCYFSGRKTTVKVLDVVSIGLSHFEILSSIARVA